MNDRMVHASNERWELVRYDRAGKWYMEPTDEGKAAGQKRRPVGINEAVEEAIRLWKEGGTVHFDRPGGGALNQKIRSRYNRQAFTR